MTIVGVYILPEDAYVDYGGYLNIASVVGVFHRQLPWLPNGRVRVLPEAAFTGHEGR